MSACWETHGVPARIKAVSQPFRSYVLVSRAQIARNYRNVCSVVGPGVDVAAVVKADAYGHGALEVSRVLVAEGAAGWRSARWMKASRCGAAASARPRILVMGGFLPYEGEALVEYDLTPAVHSLDQIARIGSTGADAASRSAIT